MSKATFNKKQPHNKEENEGKNKSSDSKPEDETFVEKISKTRMSNEHSIAMLAEYIDDTPITNILEELEKYEGLKIRSIICKIKCCIGLDYHKSENLLPWMLIVFKSLCSELQLELNKRDKLIKNVSFESMNNKENDGFRRGSIINELTDHKSCIHEKSSQLKIDETKVEKTKSLNEYEQSSGLETIKKQPKFFYKIFNALSCIVNFTNEKNSGSKQEEKIVIESQQEEINHLIPKETIENNKNIQH